jgi:hypothetical protein
MRPPIRAVFSARSGRGSDHAGIIGSPEAIMADRDRPEAVWQSEALRVDISHGGGMPLATIIVPGHGAPSIAIIAWR